MMDIRFLYRPSGVLPKNPVPGSFYFLKKEKSELWFCFDKDRKVRVDNETIELDADKVNEIIREYLNTNGISLNGYATESWVRNIVSSYAKKTDIPKKTSDLTNDSGFLTEHQSLDGLASESWVEEKGYLTEHQPIKTVNGQSITGSGDVQITGVTPEQADEIAKISGKADSSSVYTKTEIDSKGYLTEHQSLEGLATEDYVDGKIESLIDGAPEALDTLKEIADWIGSDETGTAELISQVIDNGSRIDVLYSTKVDDSDFEEYMSMVNTVLDDKLEDSDLDDIRDDIAGLKSKKMIWKTV